jgi:hypothetical protein
LLFTHLAAKRRRIVVENLKKEIDAKNVREENE